MTARRYPMDTSPPETNMAITLHVALNGGRSSANTGHHRSAHTHVSIFCGVPAKCKCTLPHPHPILQESPVTNVPGTPKTDLFNFNPGLDISSLIGILIIVLNFTNKTDHPL